MHEKRGILLHAQRDAKYEPQDFSFRPRDNSPFSRYLTLIFLLCLWEYYIRLCFILQYLIYIKFMQVSDRLYKGRIEAVC